MNAPLQQALFLYSRPEVGGGHRRVCLIEHKLMALIVAGRLAGNDVHSNQVDRTDANCAIHALITNDWGSAWALVRTITQ